MIARHSEISPFRVRANFVRVFELSMRRCTIGCGAGLSVPGGSLETSLGVIEPQGFQPRIRRGR